MAVTGIGAIPSWWCSPVMLMIYGATCIGHGIRERSTVDPLLSLLGAVVGLLLEIYTGDMMSIMIVLVALFLIVFGV